MAAEVVAKQVLSPAIWTAPKKMGDFLNLFGEHRLDFFFSEDILVGSEPDISFGLRLSRAY